MSVCFSKSYLCAEFFSTNPNPLCCVADTKAKQESPRPEKVVKDSGHVSHLIIDQNNHTVNQTPVSRTSDTSKLDKAVEPLESKDVPNKEKLENINEIIDIKTLLMAGSSCKAGGISPQTNQTVDDSLCDGQEQKSQENICEKNEVEESLSLDEPQSPSSPINLFCEEGDVSNNSDITHRLL